MIAQALYSSGEKKGGERIHAHLHEAVIDRCRFVQAPSGQSVSPTRREVRATVHGDPG
jgi:hypothetical protein